MNTDKTIQERDLLKQLEAEAQYQSLLRDENAALKALNEELLQKLEYADKKLSELIGPMEYNLGDYSHVSTAIQATIQKARQQ